MTARSIIADGWTRVRAQPGLLLVAYVANVLLVLPLTAAMYAVLRASMGRGLVAERMKQGWDDLWYRGFRVGADEFAQTFKPSVSGIGAPMHALDDLVTGGLFELPASIMAAGMAYVLVWVFVSGGLVHRYAHPKSERGFWSAAGQSFPRLLLIVGVGWVAFGLLFRYGFVVTGTIAETMTRDSVDERVHFAWMVFKYAAIWLLVGAVRLVVDYAKVAAVLSPGQGTLACMRRGAEVVSTRTGAVLGVAAAAVGLQLALLAVYAVFAPGVEHPNAFLIFVAWVISQSFVLGRIALRCWSVAAQTALSQQTP